MMGIVKVLLGIFLLAYCHLLYAVCSDHYKGKATINEIGMDDQNFIEVKLLDTSIPLATYQAWSVRACKVEGQVKCSTFSLSGIVAENTAYLVVGTSKELPKKHKDFDVILQDADGKTIDYLSVGITEQQDQACALEFDSDMASSHTHNYRRIPDGTGDWQDTGDHGSDYTQGFSNGGEAETGDNVAKYQLEESSWGGSDSILDSSGNNNHASPAGNIVSTTDNPISCQASDIPYNNDKAMRDAINTGVDVNTLGDKGSIAFWYRGNNAWDDISEAKVLFDASTSSSAQFLMYIWPGGYLEFEATEPDGDRAERYTNSKSFASSEWVHIAVTWDAINDEVKIYLNGVSQSLNDYTGKSLTQGLNTSMEELYFGDNNSTSASALGGSADGVIDEIQLFNYVLTSAEVSTVKDDVTPCAAIVVHHFEIIHDAFASTCADESVTIKACANSDCSSLVADSLSLDFQGNASTISSPTFIGSTTFNYSHSTEETLTLSVSTDSSVTVSNALVCDDGSGTSCDIVFSSSGCENSCAAYFPDSIQGHDASSELKFEQTGRLLNDSDNIVTFPTLTDKTGSHKTCDSVDCTTNGTAAPALTLPSFETTSATNDMSLSSGTSTIGPSGDNAVTEMDNLTIKGSANVTFLASGGTYKIDNGLFEGSAQITFNTGIYWFNELEISDDVQIFVNGAVTIYVNGQSDHFDIEGDVKINIAGSAEDLVFVSYKDFHLKNDAQVHAVLYGAKKIEIKDQVQHVGVISVYESLKIKKTATVTYEDISNVRVGDLCGGSSGNVDHFEITHDGSGLTCDTESVIIKACTNSDCSTLSADAVTLDFQGNSSTISSPTFTGYTTVNFNHTTAETLTLSVANPTIAPDNTLVCDDGGGSSCDLVFADAGFRFLYGAAESTTIANQTSGDNFTDIVKLQAVENVSGVCTGMFIGDVDVELSQQNTAPSGTSGLNFKVNSTVIAKYPTYTSNITLNFGAESKATLTNPAYLDAGQIRLHAHYDDGDIILSGNSNDFWVSPKQLVVTAKSGVITLDNSTTTPGDNRIHKAGVDFDIEIIAYNSLGTAAANITTNYQPNGDDRVEFTATRTGPVAGVDGTLSINGQTVVLASDLTGFTDISLTSASFSNGMATVSANYSEVGLLQVQARDNDYSSDNVIISSLTSNVGRFTPDHFDVAKDDGFFEHYCTDGISSFSYTGQPFGYEALFLPELTITAKNAAGVTTQNYTETDYQKLVASDIDRTFPGEDTEAKGLDAVTKMVAIADENEGSLPLPPSSSAGVMTYTFSNLDTITYLRNTNSLRAPFFVKYDITIDEIKDSDDIEGISLPTVSPQNGFVGFGRWNIEHTFGPETSDLTLPMALQSWDGSSFITNTIDSCTAFDGTTTTNYTLDNTNLTPAISPTTLTSTSGAGTFASGLAQLLILKPSDGSQGKVRFTYDATPLWLKYNWNGVDEGLDDLPYDDNPSAIATFGLFRGNDRIIYQREINN